MSALRRLCYGPSVVSHVYTARIRVRHNELDAFGRVYPAAHLRWLAQAAIDASSDAGFDAAYYLTAGAHWLVRRTTFSVLRLVRADTDLDVTTWVADFRRVRSLRRYEIRDVAGTPVVTAATDWVFVDLSGRLRRVPEAMERQFGHGPETSLAREPWSAPEPPATPGRAVGTVRWADLDSLGHVNNAAYLDVLTEATLAVLGDAGWPMDRLAAAGPVPHVASGDIEYLDAAVFGDELATTTWFVAAPDALCVHQQVTRVGDGRAIVRGSTTWRWTDAADAVVPLPAGLADALRPLRAA